MIEQQPEPIQIDVNDLIRAKDDMLRESQNALAITMARLYATTRQLEELKSVKPVPSVSEIVPTQ